MTQVEPIAVWAMAGTWVNAIAMAAAALFAGLAWRAQTRLAGEERERHRRTAAVEAARAAVVDLTTGEVARARDSVASWISGPAGLVPHTGSPDVKSRRAGRLVGTMARTETRRDAFIVLWSLQRLAPLSEELDYALESQRAVLAAQISLIAGSLRGLAHLLDPEERVIFHESAVVAIDSVVAVAGALSSESGLASQWKADLSLFLREGSDR